MGKPASSMTIAPEPVKYSVKNTFIEPLDTWTPAMEQALVEPAHQSMPAGALQDHITEEKSSAAALLKVYTSPRDSEADTGSTKDSERPLVQDSDSESQDAPNLPPISIKNSFVHFESDSKEHVDPRIIQSMPAGTFAEKIEEERVLAANTGHQKQRPSALSDDSEAETENSSSMLFPSTPNAENQMSFDTRHGEAVPVVHFIPASTTALGECSVSVLPPALWTATAPAPAPSLSPAPGPPAVLLQGPPEGVPPGSALPMPPPPPTCFVPGTPVVLQGLSNQSNFNGLSGVVSSFDADCGRYNVMIEIGPNGAKRLVKVKFQNLILAQQSSVSQPPGCLPVQASGGMPRPAKAALVLDQMV